MEWLGSILEWGPRINWLWSVISGLFGGGLMYAVLRKFFLPKEISESSEKLRKELKKEFQKEIRTINKQITDLKKVDPGYTVLSWWDPPITIFDNIFGRYHNYPRVIFVKKTGEIKEFPDLRKTGEVKKLPNPK